MSRVSNKKEKTMYQVCREELGWSREKASEELGISPERIERIENEKLAIYPEEVVTMAECYKNPNLCNYYCSNKCPIGVKHVPEIKIKDLSQIVLEMLASLNSMNKKKERLIEITVDGDISNDEMEDFVRIQKELEQISITVETLRLWSEQMIANGLIDEEAYEECKKRLNK